jgi:hypothetical protein
MSSASGGDIELYRTVYNDMPDYGFSDGFMFYYQWISSLEFGHYVLIWIASRLIDQTTFVAFSNAMLAYLAMSLFQKWKASLYIASILVVTNFYLYVMYFSTERLKIAFIFLALSFLFADKLKNVCAFALLASITHIQTIIVYISMIFSRCYELLIKLVKTGKTFRYVVAFPLLLIPPFLLREHISLKIEAYYHETEFVEFARIVLLFLLALWYSKNRLETVLLFIPVFVSIYFIGGERINFIGYFLFLYYGLQVNRGLNFGVLATTIYFAYMTIGFCMNTLNVFT